jgi:Kef-type K+ transport system membrane component KefB
MDSAASGLIIVGALLVAGLAVDSVAVKTRLPRVSLLVALGVLIGPVGLDLLTDEAKQWFPAIAAIALVMVGFLLGGEFSRANLKSHGWPVITLALLQAVITALVVSVGLLALGVEAVVALALGGIAAATDPVAVAAEVKSAGAVGPFKRILLGVVAVDDVFGIWIFTVLLAVGAAVAGIGSPAALAGIALRDVLGAVLLGVVLGVPIAHFSGRIRPGTPTTEEALGAVFLCAGLALAFDVSFLLAAVVMGAVVVNRAEHHVRAFHEIENIEWPFLVVFFVLAGASVDSASVAAAGWVLGAYLVLRLGGKLLGGLAGSRFVPGGPGAGVWFGAAMLPQAGVALGMALLAAEEFPNHADKILSVTIVGTLVFEMIGPILTNTALRKVGEVK